MARFCTNCGSELADGARFCTNCGAPVEAMEVPAADPIEEFKENNPVPAPAAESIPTVAAEMPEPAPAPEPAPETSSAYTPAPEVIPEPTFATGPASSPAPAPAPAPAASAAASVAGITQRSVALCIILSIVTCGIYGLYWLYKLNDEVNALAEEPTATSGGLVILFTIITCGIYGWYWNYKMGERIDRIKGTGDSNKVLFIVLAIFGLCIVDYAIMQDTINDRVGA